MLISEKKSLLRKQLKQTRLLLTASEQRAHGMSVRDQLLQLDPFKQAIHIGVYLAHNGEIDLQPTIDIAWQQHKKIYLPQVSLATKKLRFAAFTPETALTQNHYQLHEPAHANPILTNTLDIVLVPLVGFDRAGHRLGMGGGHYDTTFAHRDHTVLIGVAHACQETEHVPTEAHDMPLDIIVTEREVLYWTP